MLSLDLPKKKGIAEVRSKIKNMDALMDPHSTENPFGKETDPKKKYIPTWMRDPVGLDEYEIVENKASHNLGPG